VTRLQLVRIPNSLEHHSGHAPSRYSWTEISEYVVLTTVLKFI